MGRDARFPLVFCLFDVFTFSFFIRVLVTSFPPPGALFSVFFLSSLIPHPHASFNHATRASADQFINGTAKRNPSRRVIIPPVSDVNQLFYPPRSPRKSSDNRLQTSLRHHFSLPISVSEICFEINKVK